jgi:RHS repeat-associated protein
VKRRIVIRLPRWVKRRLRREGRKTPDAALRTRIRIVLLYEAGWGAHRIAASLGCVPATAVRVARRFQALGEDGLRDGRCDNGLMKVDDDLRQALAELVAVSPQDHGWPRPTWTRELLVKTLRQHTGVKVSVTTVARMLSDLGARWGMARPIVLCPWLKARKARRLRAIFKIVHHLPAREVAYFEDEIDIHLNPRIGRDWMLRGQQKLVVTPGQNRKRYLAGALAVDGHDLLVVQSERKNDPVLSDANNYLYSVFRRGLAETLTFYHTDHLNTPIAMTGSGVTFVWRAELFPFGGVQSLPVSTTQNNLRFPGQYFDTDTNLHYNLFRNYAPKPGRYSQPDPTGFLGGLNLYLYVGANPLSFIDPDGLRALIACTRCGGMAGSMRCATDEDGKPGLSFNTNEGQNESSATPGDPFGTNGPLPPGQYDLPNAFSSKFKRILPSPTNTGVPGKVRTPAGTIRSGIRVHAGRLSQGCVTTGPGQPGIDTERAIVELVRRNRLTGGTSMTIQEDDCNASCQTCPPK